MISCEICQNSSCDIFRTFFSVYASILEKEQIEQSVTESLIRELQLELKVKKT